MEAFDRGRMARAAKAYEFEVTDNVPYRKLYVRRPLGRSTARASRIS